MENIYLRPYTVDWNNEESDSLHLEYSYDLKEWYRLNGDNAVLYAVNGSKRMLSPQIIKNGDSDFTIYAMDALSNDKAFVYNTKDFIEFSEEKYVDTDSLTDYKKESTEIEISKAELEGLNKRYGKPEEIKIIEIEELVIDAKKGETVVLPDKITVKYSNNMTELKTVTWKEKEISGEGSVSVEGSIKEHQYTNPIIYHRADPFVYKHTDGSYYFVASHTDMEHNLVGEFQYRYIFLRKSATIEGLADGSGLYEEKMVYTRNPITGNNSPHIWAPEFHFIDGKFYIYFTTVIDEDNMWSIRPHVLECSGTDPMKDEWVNLGQIKTSTDDSIAFTDFSLDHTVLQLNGEKYLFWAEKHPFDSDIYAAKMINPWTIDSSRICKVVAPEYNWELHGFRVCEGPAFLHRNGKLFMTYSASGTDALYCLGMCTADDTADLLDPASWTKSIHPVFQSSQTNGQYGPGHNSFTYDEEGYDVMVYHARQEEKYLIDPEYQPLYDAGRNATLMRVYWNEDGTPNFSVPIKSGKGHDIVTNVKAVINFK